MSDVRSWGLWVAGIVEIDRPLVSRCQRMDRIVSQREQPISSSVASRRTISRVQDRSRPGQAEVSSKETLDPALIAAKKNCDI